MTKAEREEQHRAMVENQRAVFRVICDQCPYGRCVGAGPQKEEDSHGK